MPAPFDTVSFLSDYGADDEFVGVVKSVIRGLAPHVTVVDLAHGIPPHDVRAGGLTLARSVQYLVPGVVLAVVDPGVGTERRALAVEAVEGGSIFVGPDNGLLAPAVAMAGGASRAVCLDDPTFHLPTPGPTFAGRDVFAPVAAHLCNGVALTDVGHPIDPDTLLPGILPLTRMEAGRLVAEVLWVDRYGNVQLNVDVEQLAPLGDPVTLTFRDRTRTVATSATYGSIGAGAVGLVIDAYGLVSLAADRHSAAAELGLDVGDSISLGDARADGESMGATSPVRLRPTTRGHEPR